MPEASVNKDSGIVTSTVNLTGVLGIRGTCTASVASGGGPSWDNSTVSIHEIQALQTNIYKRASFHLAKKILGKMQDYNSAWETPGLTTGTWTAPSAQLNPDTLKSLWWNELLVGTDNILIYVRTGATQVLCEAAAWVGPFTNPNAQTLASVTVAPWVQYKVTFSCTDTTVSNPRIYSANGFLLKISYSKGATQAETSVEYIYDIGFRHFDQPMIDKVFQKIMTYHEGSEGSFKVQWETENDSGEFIIDLTTTPERWSSFFPSNAYGKQVKIKIYKNDLYAFKLKELQGVYSPQPLII